MKQQYTFEEVLLILEEHMMNDLSQRLRELWREKQNEKEGFIHAVMCRDDTIKQLMHTTPTVPSGGNSGGAHTVGEVMADVDDLACAYEQATDDYFNRTRDRIEAAITRLVSDREVLLKVATDATDDAEYYCQYAGDYLVEKHGIYDSIKEYRAAIQKVTK